MADPANLIRRFAGDDWTVAPITLTAGGGALDLTGSEITAEVWTAYQVAPATVLAEGAGLTVAVDRTTGVITDLWVPKAVTSAIEPRDRRDPGFPNRIDIVVTDSLGRSRVWLVIPVQVLDRRVDLPPASAPVSGATTSGATS